jgi:hypothetical protein
VKSCDSSEDSPGQPKRDNQMDPFQPPSNREQRSKIRLITITSISLPATYTNNPPRHFTNPVLQSRHRSVIPQGEEKLNVWKFIQAITHPGDTLTARFARERACPECGSKDLTEDGHYWEGNDRRPKYFCTNCHRYSA